MRSILTKVDELRYTLLSKDIDIFACAESWLCGKHDDSIVAIDGYNLFRRDRSHKIGGGVAAWIKASIPVICYDFGSTVTEFEALVLQLPYFCMVLFIIYVPPDTALRDKALVNNLLVDWADEVLKSAPSCELFLCGDLNRLGTLELCNSLNLIDLHNMPTYGNAHLDYILTSENLSDSYKVTEFPPIDISKTPHISLLASPVIKFKTRSHILRTVYDLRSSNVTRFLSALTRFDWCFLTNSSLTLDDKCSLFHGALESMLMENIPSSVVKCTGKDKPWITSVIKDMINKRWAAYRDRNFVVYNHLKVKIRDEILKSKRLWSRRLTSKNLWKAVHTQTGMKTSNPITSLLSQFDDIDAAVNGINRALSSVFLPVTVARSSSPHSDEWQIQFSSSDIEKLLQKTPAYKASPDIPTVLYKKAAALLAKPLHLLFCQSITEMKLPVKWKIASVCPVPKIKNPTVDDIRPISVLPLPVKILEKLVVNSLKFKFLQHFGPQQFGYKPKSSTLSALVSLHEHLTRFLDNPRTLGAMVVTYDYSKAFDRMRNDLTIERLVQCGFPSQFISWVHDYLSNRYQYVRIGNSVSSKIAVTSGVPQGSILGPYLFALTTGAFSHDDTKCHLIKYADDTTLCFPIYKPPSTNQHIFQEHKKLIDWSTQMDLKINNKKCQSMIIRKTANCECISLPGVTPVNSLKILGVTFNSRASWSLHFDNIVKIASQRFYALRLLRPCLSKQDMITVYNAILRSILEYCAPLFLGLTTVDSVRLEKVQKRFHRLLCGDLCRSSCLVPLSDRRLRLSMKFLTKIRSDCNDILHKELPIISATGRFILPPRNTTRRSSSSIPLACEK